MSAVKTKEKSTRGNSSQFFVAGELCRRGYSAVVTLGNTPNTDVLCSNIEGTKFVHLQVKTFVPGNSTCSVGRKAEKYYGSKFFWVLAGIPHPHQDREFEYYIIPSKIMSEKVFEGHQRWLSEPGVNGHVRKDSSVRTVHLPPKTSYINWDISKYKNRWDLLDKKLQD